MTARRVRAELDPDLVRVSDPVEVRVVVPRVDVPVPVGVLEGQRLGAVKEAVDNVPAARGAWRTSGVVILGGAMCNPARLCLKQGRDQPALKPTYALRVPI